MYMSETNKKDKMTKISVIVYGNNSDRWATLRQGLDQGALDFGVEVNFVMMSNQGDDEEQAKLLSREIENGAEGIILAATDSLKMKEPVREASLFLPVVTVETNIYDMEGLSYISADNYSMGLNIGRSVYLSSEENKRVAVIMDNQHRNSVYERYQGFMDSLQFTDCEIIRWELHDEEIDIVTLIQNQMEEHPVDVIVALEDEKLEEVSEAIDFLEADVDLYGIGSTNKIVHYLDYGIIKSIVFQNEFNMGYLSMQEVIQDIKRQGEKLNVEIEFRTVNRETMYLPNNQRLVFPIVQ
jgi:ribose transport system substrate-binding protein